MYAQLIQALRAGAQRIEHAYLALACRLFARMQAGRAGQSTLEWALIALLIAVVAYAAYRFLGQQVSTKVSQVGTTIGGTSGAPTP